MAIVLLLGVVAWQRTVDTLPVEPARQDLTQQVGQDSASQLTGEAGAAATMEVSVYLWRGVDLTALGFFDRDP